jgi:hypothetical protein
VGALKDAAVKPPIGRRPMLDQLLADLDAEDSADLHDLLHDSTVSDQVISGALATIGHKVGSSTVALWRRTNGVR